MTDKTEAPERVMSRAPIAMRIEAKISMSELEQIISEGLKKEYPDLFPEGAQILWRTTDNQLGMTIVSATAVPKKYVSGKD